MPLDPEVASQLSGQMLAMSASSAGRINGAFENAAQATALAFTTAVQAGAAASQFGSDRTAIHTPATDAATNAAKV